MSKSDRIKEELSWLKLVFGLLVAIDVSLIAWLAQNVVITSVGVWVNRAAIKRFEQLEKE